MEAALSTVILMNSIVAVLNFGFSITSYLYLPTVGCIAFAAWTGVEAVSSFESKSASETIIVDGGGRVDSRVLRGVDRFEYHDVITMALTTLRVVSVFVWGHVFFVGAVVVAVNMASLADSLPHVYPVRVVVPHWAILLWMIGLAIELHEKCAGYSVVEKLRGAYRSRPWLVKVIISCFLKVVSFFFRFNTFWMGALLVLSVMERMTPKHLPRYVLPRVLGFVWLAVRVLKKCWRRVLLWKLGEMCRSQPRCKSVRALVMVAGIIYTVLLYLLPLPPWWRFGLVVTHTVRALNVLSSLRRENGGANVRGIFRVRGVGAGVVLPA